MQDQCRRYIEIKQSDMPPAEAAKKTKEFRCPPKEQMLRLLNFKKAEDQPLDEEGEVEECPMDKPLQEQLLTFHDLMIKRMRCKAEEAESTQMVLEEFGWVDKLAQFIVPMPPPLPVVLEKAKNGAGMPDCFSCVLSN